MNDVTAVYMFGSWTNSTRLKKLQHGK